MPDLKLETAPDGSYGVVGIGTQDNIKVMADGSVEIPSLTNPELAGKLDANKNIVLGTAVSATGTAIDFTGIPSTAKRVTLGFVGLSANSATSAIIHVQLGVGGVPVNTGYSGSYASFTSGALNTAAWATSGAFVSGAQNNVVATGSIILEKLTPTLWMAKGSAGRTDITASFVSEGHVTVAGDVDLVRLTTSNGTDQFDAGTVNISWE